MLQHYRQYIQNLLPLKQLTIVCEFKESVKLPCFHQTVFPEYLYTLLDRLPPEQAKTCCRFTFPENGNTHYQQGDQYNFGITLFGKSSDHIASNLIQKLTLGIQAQDNRTLHNNLKIIQLIDGFSGEIIETPKQLTAWQQQDLDLLLNGLQYG